MAKHRPSKRERIVHQSGGHSHSPPTNSKAIRKANLQRLDAMKGRHGLAHRQAGGGIAGSLAAERMDLPKSERVNPLATANAKAHSIRAFVPVRGQGQGAEKPRVTPADKKRFAGETEKYITVDKAIGRKANGGTKAKVVTRHKPVPQAFMGDYARQQRSDGKRHAELPDAEYLRVCHNLGIDPETGRPIKN